MAQSGSQCELWDHHESGEVIWRIVWQIIHILKGSLGSSSMVHKGDGYKIQYADIIHVPIAALMC